MLALLTLFTAHAAFATNITAPVVSTVARYELPVPNDINCDFVGLLTFAANAVNEDLTSSAAEAFPTIEQTKELTVMDSKPSLPVALEPVAPVAPVAPPMNPPVNPPVEPVLDRSTVLSVGPPVDFNFNTHNSNNLLVVCALFVLLQLVGTPTKQQTEVKMSKTKKKKRRGLSVGRKSTIK